MARNKSKPVRGRAGASGAGKRRAHRLFEEALDAIEHIAAGKVEGKVVVRIHSR